MLVGHDLNRSKESRGLGHLRKLQTISAVGNHSNATIARARCVVGTLVQAIRMLSSVRCSQSCGMVDLALQLGVLIDAQRTSIYYVFANFIRACALTSKS